MSYYEVIGRLLMAIIIGGVIGYEREQKNRPAGFRTHILVCVGAAVISIIQVNTINEVTKTILANPTLQAALKADIGRMGAQVITGVGFLGAGTIIREKGLVKGLTTAASIWVVACIGLAVGLGYYFVSTAATVSVFISLAIFKKIEKRLFTPSTLLELKIECKSKKILNKHIKKYFDKKNIEVENVEVFKKAGDLFCDDQETEESIYTLLIPKILKCTKIIKDLSKLHGINKVTPL